MHVDFLRAVKDALFLKKPLEFVFFVYSNSENAVASRLIR